MQLLTASRTSTQYDATPNRFSAWALRAGVFTTAVLVVLINPYDRPVAQIWMGILIVVISIWPLDRWLLNKRRAKIPLLELHLLFYAFCFGVAAFVDPPRHTMIQLRISEQSYTLGLLAALVSIIALQVGFYLAQGFSGKFLARLTPRFPVGRDELAVLYLYPLTVAMSLISDIFGITEIAQVVPVYRLFAFTWCLCAAWSGQLQRPLALAFLYIAVPLELLLFSGIFRGLLFGILAYAELIGVCYLIYKGRMPMSLIVVALALFMVLQPIKSKYRNVIWKQGSEMSTFERAEWLIDNATLSVQDTSMKTESMGGFEESFARVNHLVAASAIIEATQASGLYRYGETLLPVLTKWIPRAVWAGKPVEDLGNRWARQYGYLDQDDYATSFNLIWLPEMFMNFAWPGVVIISLMIGGFMGVVKRGIIDRVRSPVETAFAYCIASAFFWPESNMSLSLGGIVIIWISLSALLLFFRTLVRLGSRAAPARSP